MKGDRKWRRSPRRGLVTAPAKQKPVLVAPSQRPRGAGPEAGPPAREGARNRSARAGARREAPDARVGHDKRNHPSTPRHSRSASRPGASWRSGLPTQWRAMKSPGARSPLPTTISWISGPERSAWNDRPIHRSAPLRRSWTTAIGDAEAVTRSPRSESGLIARRTYLVRTSSPAAPDGAGSLTFDREWI